MTITTDFLEVGDIIEADDSWIVNDVSGVRKRSLLVQQSFTRSAKGQMELDYPLDALSLKARDAFGDGMDVSILIGSNGCNLRRRRFVVIGVNSDVKGELEGVSVPIQMVKAAHLMPHEDKLNKTELSLSFYQVSEFDQTTMQTIEDNIMCSVNRTGKMKTSMSSYLHEILLR